MMDDAEYAKELARRIEHNAKVIEALADSGQTRRLCDLALEIVGYCTKIDNMRRRATVDK